MHLKHAVDLRKKRGARVENVLVHVDELLAGKLPEHLKLAFAQHLKYEQIVLALEEGGPRFAPGIVDPTQGAGDRFDELFERDAVAHANRLELYWVVEYYVWVALFVADILHPVLVVADRLALAAHALPVAVDFVVDVQLVMGGGCGRSFVGAC